MGQMYHSCYMMCHGRGYENNLKEEICSKGVFWTWYSNGIHGFLAAVFINRRPAQVWASEHAIVDSQGIHEAPTFLSNYWQLMVIGGEGGGGRRRCVIFFSGVAIDKFPIRNFPSVLVQDSLIKLNTYLNHIQNKSKKFRWGLVEKK